MKNNFYYQSKDGQTQIHTIEWIPDGKIKAVLQISHGMVEYIDRYDEFAKFLNQRGYYVVGQDHLGHGESVRSEECHGFFHEDDGNECVIGDIHELRQMTEKRFPDVPYFLLGHSMGSFLTRQYIQMHGAGLDGAIIMGTGNQPLLLVKLGKLVCKIIAGWKGWNYRSTFVNNMAFGGYNKKFHPAKTSVDWLSRNEDNVKKYIQDPWCTFIFTLNGYYHMFRGMEQLAKKENFNRIPKTLPVLFVSGQDDPVGRFGKGVKHVYKKYRNGGISDASIKLYEDDRHEILNEIDRYDIFEDLYQWLESKSR